MHEPLLLNSFDYFLLDSVDFLILKLCDQTSEFFLESLGSSSRNWTRGYYVSLTKGLRSYVLVRSCTNVASKALVEKLALPLLKHPRP